MATVGTCTRAARGAATEATARWRVTGAAFEGGGDILANVGGWTFPSDADGAADVRGLGGGGVTFAKVGALTGGGATRGAEGRFDSLGAFTGGGATSGGGRLESVGAFTGRGATRVGVVFTNGALTCDGATLETEGFGSVTAPRDAAGGRIAGGGKMPPRLAVWGVATVGGWVGLRIVEGRAIGPLGRTVLGGCALPPNTAEL